MSEIERLRAVVTAARNLVMWPGKDDRPGPDDSKDAWFTHGEMTRYNTLVDEVFALDIALAALSSTPPAAERGEAENASLLQQRNGWEIAAGEANARAARLERENAALREAWREPLYRALRAYKKRDNNANGIAVGVLTLDLSAVYLAVDAALSALPEGEPTS